MPYSVSEELPLLVVLISLSCDERTWGRSAQEGARQQRGRGLVRGARLLAAADGGLGREPALRHVVLQRGARDEHDRDDELRRGTASHSLA